MGGGASSVMATLFGSDVSDTWLQSRGEDMGKDIMSMIIAEMYDDDELELPSNARRSRSHNPNEVVSNSGLAKGQMQGILGPLVAGMMNAMKSGDVKQQLVRFATDRAPKTIMENADSITSQGKSLGDMLLKGLGQAAKAKAEGAASASHRGHRSRAVPAMDDVINVDAAAKPGGKWGLRSGAGDLHSKIVAAVMKPVAAGLNSTLKQPKRVEVLADAMADLVPLATVKRVMKTTLRPQYQKAARSIRPQLEAYGASAGEKVLEYLKTKVAGEEEEEEGPGMEASKQRALARNIAKDPRNIDRDLLGPVMEPIIAGITAVLAGGDWSMMKKGLLWALAGFLCRRYCCDCTCNCGGGDTDEEEEEDEDDGGSVAGAEAPVAEAAAEAQPDDQ